jgi:hypothetical protein
MKMKTVTSNRRPPDKFNIQSADWREIEAVFDGFAKQLADHGLEVVMYAGRRIEISGCDLEDYIEAIFVGFDEQLAKHDLEVVMYVDGGGGSYIWKIAKKSKC